MNLALFGGGGVKTSLVARIPHLADRLGPVAAGSYRLASRVVNGLRAGYAVKTPDGLSGAAVVLLRVPDASLQKAVSTLSRANIPWAGKTVLLCDAAADSAVLDPLRARGAFGGSLSGIEGCPAFYLLEGDRGALRRAREIARWLGGRTIELDRARLPLFEAGLTLATTLFTPVVAAAEECLSGGAANTSLPEKLAAALFQKTLRGWLKHGRGGWTGVPAADKAAMKRRLRALESANPPLARYYRHTAAFALEYFVRSGRRPTPQS